MTERYMKEAEVGRFKRLMLENGYDSITKLAEAMGLDRTALSRRINGRSDWSRSEMEIVGKLFGEEPASIFFDE